MRIFSRSRQEPTTGPSWLTRAKKLLEENNYSKDFVVMAVAAIDPDLFVDIVLAYQARKREHEEWEALEARRKAFDERRMYVWRLTHDHS